MGSLSVDGLTLHYEARGAGDPAVLLHGFTSSITTFSLTRG